MWRKQESDEKWNYNFFPFTFLPFFHFLLSLFLFLFFFLLSFFFLFFPLFPHFFSSLCRSSSAVSHGNASVPYRIMICDMHTPEGWHQYSQGHPWHDIIKGVKLQPIELPSPSLNSPSATIPTKGKGPPPKTTRAQHATCTNPPNPKHPPTSPTLWTPRPHPMLLLGNSITTSIHECYSKVSPHFSSPTHSWCPLNMLLLPVVAIPPHSVAATPLHVVVWLHPVDLGPGLGDPSLHRRRCCPGWPRRMAWCGRVLKNETEW